MISERNPGRECCASLRRAINDQRAPEYIKPVLRSHESAVWCQHRTTEAIVDHLHRQLARYCLDRYPNSRGVRILGSVREGFRTEKVRSDLDIMGEPVRRYVKLNPRGHYSGEIDNRCCQALLIQSTWMDAASECADRLAGLGDQISQTVPVSRFRNEIRNPLKPCLDPTLEIGFKSVTLSIGHIQQTSAG